MIPIRIIRLSRRIVSAGSTGRGSLVERASLWPESGGGGRMKMENTRPPPALDCVPARRFLEGSASDHRRSGARPAACKAGRGKGGRFGPTFRVAPPRPWLFPRRAGRCLMSVAIRTAPLISSEFSSSLPSSPTSHPVQHESEAPERAEHDREAPEWRAGRWTEAPDAGEGRAGLLE